MSESTPLRQHLSWFSNPTAATATTATAGGGSVLGGSSGGHEEWNKFVGNLFSPENMQQARSIATSRIEELRHAASTGDVSIRFLALLAGMVLFGSASSGIIGSLFHLRFLAALLEVYTAALGILILVLESKQLQLSEIFMQKVYKYALFLKFVWGRGVLYFVAGSLQVSHASSNGSKNLNLMDFCIGLYVMGVGVLYIVVGRRTAQKLRALRQSQQSELMLRQAFRTADSQNTGSLTLEQFMMMTNQLGIDLNRRECEAAFLYMDKDGTNAVSFDEIRVWYTESDASDFI